MKVENHKYVDSYWVEELPNGVIHLLINCKKRWLYYHAYNDYEFVISENDEENTNGLIFKIQEFLPKKEDEFYIQTSAQNKEQLSFYYIPHKYEDNSKFLIE